MLPSFSFRREDSKETKSSHGDDHDNDNDHKKGDSNDKEAIAESTKSPSATSTSNSSTSSTLTSNLWLREHAKEFLDEWTRGGLSRYVDLPMICVIGDTSSGKSSVLSSLIGFELPSASTLTTKCPVLVQLHHAPTAAQAKAVVDIHWHQPKQATANTDIATETNANPTPRARKRNIEKQVESVLDTSPSSALPANQSQQGSPSEKQLPPPPPPPQTQTQQTQLLRPPKWESRTIIHNWQSRVPTVIQQAQQLILNSRDAVVAPDVICVSLWSTQCQPDTELTLVDLPGLVQFQHHHPTILLQQVEQVVSQYVHNPRTILVPVLPAPTNIHNSKVLQWAKQVDPATRRTIPVFTKPDLMDPGSETDVSDLLLQPLSGPTTSQNDGDISDLSRDFQHGFYLVKNRGQAAVDAGATLEEALALEQDYFSSTPPWNSLPVSRLGIPALRSKLSQVLWQVMQDCLQDIWQELDQQFSQTQDQLAQLGGGAILSTRVEQRKFYHSLSHQLVSHVSSSLSGKGNSKLRLRRKSQHKMSQQQQQQSANDGTKKKDSRGEVSPAPTTTTAVGGASQLHAACHQFSQDIQNGSLACIGKLHEGSIVLVSSPTSFDVIPGEIVYLAPNQSYACVDSICEKDHTAEVLFERIDLVSDDPDFEEDEVWSQGSRVFIGRAGGQYDSLRKIPCSRIRTDPAWLAEKMAEYRTDDLACFVNVDMFQQLVAELVEEEWAPPCYKLVDALERIMTDTLQSALQEQLDQQTKRFPLLQTMMESTCHQVAKNLLSTAKNQVKEHLELEAEHPYTQDQVLLNAMNQSRFKSLRQDLETHLKLDQEGVVYDTQAIRLILDRVFQKHQQNNWMAEQMELVLSSYGEVTTQRVLDRTPQICWQTCRTLAKVLQEELGSITDEVLEACLWETPEIRQQYTDLTKQLADLQRALDVVKTWR